LTSGVRFSGIETFKRASWGSLPFDPKREKGKLPHSQEHKKKSQSVAKKK